jgi:MFS transporter, DHA2 family, multidrug resistance protein
MSQAAAAAAPERQGGTPDKADFSAWLAVFAGSLGALMATLDISIVNSSLPTIQGEIGASGTEGTWIATSYLVAEIIIIPLAAWLERVFGLRNFLLVSTLLFTAFSVMCGLSTSLPMMIVGRAGQGITGGALIPTAMTIIATRLPPHQQPIGTAMFGVTAILGPVMGPLIGGWLTENVSWHYAFFLNVPVSAVLMVLLLVGLPYQKPHLEDLKNADWLGVLGMALGLGGLTVVLEEGQREQWFESELIIQLTGVAIVGFILIGIGQMVAKKPVIRLKLLLDRQFGSVVAMGIVLGMTLYGTSYVIPQFLASIADYNALQAGQIVLIAGIPSLMLMPFTPLLMKYVDIRIAVTFGMLVMATSCYIDTSLTAESVGSAFVDSQLLRGVGQIFVMLFLNQAAIRSVPPAMAGDASGLFNAARNIGGSVGLAMLATVQDQRSYFHARRLEEVLPANSIALQDYLNTTSQALGSMSAAIRALGGTVQREALVMTYNDMFWLLSMFIVTVTPLVIFLRPLPQGAPPAAMH